MLALYRDAGSGFRGEAAGVKPILEERWFIGSASANVAVLVGTALDPSKSRRPANMPGITINTFWGEMAAARGIC